MQDNIERDSSELSKYTIFDNLRLLQAFNILCYNTKSYDFFKSNGQTNRFAILNYYENLVDKIKIKNSKKKSTNLIFSNDNLTKSLQKTFYKRLNNNYNIEIVFLLKKMMLQDIKKICKFFFNKKNIILINIKEDIEHIIIPYIYNKTKQISFKTNDPSLFNTIPILDNPIYNIINMNKRYISSSSNNIYYINNLDTIKNIDILKNNSSNFIIDLKSDFHNINQVRILSFKDSEIKLKDEEFDIYTLFKTWATLLYTNIDGIINN
jgi:hypothetical protein